jgi:hypothetical protein
MSLGLLLLALIHRSAWNRNSPKLNFAFTEFSEVRIASVRSLRPTLSPIPMP